MAKAKRPRGRPKAPAETEIVQVRMPTALADRLRGTLKGIGAEIRDRLAYSLDDDDLPESTRDLLAAVKWIAEELRRQTSPWPTNEKTQLALMTAIQTWVELSSPQGDRGAVSDLFGPDDPPTVGRTIARTYVRIEKAKQEVTQQLLAAHPDIASELKRRSKKSAPKRK